MGDYKEMTGHTKVGDFLRKIGKSDILEKVVNVAGQAVSGNYLGALKELIRKDSDITPEQRKEAFTLLELDYADLKDARDLQKVALQQSDLFSKRFIYYLAMASFAFAVTIVIMLFFIEVPDKNQDVVNFILGIVVGNGLTQVFQFFFGSSKGSKDKEDRLNSMIG